LAIEHAKPGGVSWMIRISPDGMSKSNANPTCSE
jgi:hypothetical protein